MATCEESHENIGRDMLRDRKLLKRSKADFGRMSIRKVLLMDAGYGNLDRPLEDTGDSITLKRKNWLIDFRGE
jgi:hypothetical protein